MDRAGAERPSPPPAGPRRHRSRSGATDPGRSGRRDPAARRERRRGALHLGALLGLGPRRSTTRGTTGAAAGWRVRVPRARRIAGRQRHAPAAAGDRADHPAGRPRLQPGPGDLAVPRGRRVRVTRAGLVRGARPALLAVHRRPGDRRGLEGPLLVGGAAAGPQLQRGAVGGAVAGGVQALVRLRIHQVPCARIDPLLGGRAVARPELDPGAVGGGARVDVEALAQRAHRAVARTRPALRGGAVAVVQLDRGAVRAVRPGHVDALAGQPGDLAGGALAAAGLDPDVVDRHRLRELGGPVRVARPVAADRDVEQHEERVVEDPAVAARVGRRLPAVLDAVDVPGDRVGGPVHGEGVEVVGERLRRSAACTASSARAAGVAGAVHGAVHVAGLAADVLHDVDLAAGRPRVLADVVAEHPERRPDALPARHLDPRLELPVRLGELVRGQQPGGGVLAGAVVALVAGRVLPPGGDHQVALAVVRGVAGAVRVVLQLVVAPAVAAGVVLPLGRVGPGAGGGVELVGPGHRRRRGSAALGGRIEQYDGRQHSAGRDRPETGGTGPPHDRHLFRVGGCDRGRGNRSPHDGVRALSASTPSTAERAQRRPRRGSHHRGRVRTIVRCRASHHPVRDRTAARGSPYVAAWCEARDPT